MAMQLLLARLRAAATTSHGLDVRKLMKQLDADSSGLVSKAEVTAMLGKFSSEPALRGHSWSDFVEGMMHEMQSQLSPTPGGGQAQLGSEQMPRTLDLNKDDTISLKELAGFVTPACRTRPCSTS